MKQKTQKARKGTVFSPTVPFRAFLFLYDLSEPARTSARSVSSRTESRSARTGSIPLSSKEIQAIDKVQHAVTVDCIIFRILSHGGTDRTADIALITQDIIELQTDCRSIAFQKVL